MKVSSIQILILRLVLAGLFLHLGLGKLEEGWLKSPVPLTQSLSSFEQRAAGIHLLYLKSVAIPLAGVWSRLMALGETALGISLLLGLLTRLSSAVGIVMVLNFHAATGLLYSLSFFGSPWAALTVAGLLVVLLARAGRWIGLDSLLAKWKPQSALW